MRIATYNVEWFDSLFDAEGALLPDDGPSGRQGVPRGVQIGALGVVFSAIDADAVMVIEAPDSNRRRDTVAMLERFAAHFGLRTRRALTGFASDTQQEIALLYDPDTIEARHDPRGEPTGKRGSQEAPRFDGTFRIDLDIDDTLDVVRFSKPPLEIAARARASGRTFRMIGVHLKSKAPYGADDPDQLMRIAIANRRKQLAQAIWLRARVAADVEAGSSLIVLGDLNDGPGLDEYEKLFGRSSVEIVMEGTAGGPELYDPNARRALGLRIGQAAPTSARFRIAQEGRYLQVLLDYAMVSADLMARRPAWRIWHPFEDPGCYAAPELREALLQASDHFPVTLDIDL